MSAGTALTVILAVGIGVTLGLLGGGGSILAVPLLVYVAGLPGKEAIATSLLVVGVTSAVAVIPHLRAGRVRWRTGLIFGAAGMVGAYLGGLAGAKLPEKLLLVAFALMMLATAGAMIRGRRNTTGNATPTDLPIRRILLDGVVVGAVTGLVGAGGGFLVVPALALLGGLPMPIAVGTSLVVIAMKSFAGLAGYLSTVQINWALAAAVTAAAVLGSLIGGRLAGRIPETTLRKTFGWFVVVMGVFTLAQELPTAMVTSLWLWAGLLLTTAVALAVHRHRSRRRATTPPQPSPPTRVGATR
ncbi:sulfite exporter TauE/SafE family protein [Melissospora conviva]|uniref:sulfite exporter TauE/SafE family protein n=1 Tax=Melissospora conviva TaxID=3388432 RepID=UPI003C1C81C7